jgi:hypothetical protein
MNKSERDEADAWLEHNRSQLKYFRSLSLRRRMEAVEGMADVVRRFARMRIEGAFYTPPVSDGGTGFPSPRRGDTQA